MSNFYEPYRYYPHSYYEIGEYKGKLALFPDWNIDKDEPRYYRDVRISPASIEKPLLRDYIGIKISEWNGNIGILPVPMYGAGYVDISEWETERVYKPLKKPRKGKDYDWEWTPDFHGMWEGRWVKKYL
jgi:hypothetical protein